VTTPLVNPVVRPDFCTVTKGPPGLRSRKLMFRCPFGGVPMVSTSRWTRWSPRALDIKTTCIYSVPMPLLNVRLSADDARRAVELRKTGVQISRIVREVIRAEHERRVRQHRAQRRTAEILAEIYAAHPDPSRAARRAFDLRDRRAARRAILRKLRRRRA